MWPTGSCAHPSELEGQVVQPFSPALNKFEMQLSNIAVTIRYVAKLSIDIFICLKIYLLENF
jgi:hypothetical protein